MTILQNEKNNLISRTCKPAIFYTHTHLILKGKKSNANLAFINNINFRREIPIWNSSSFCVPRVNHANVEYRCRGKPKNMQYNCKN